MGENYQKLKGTEQCVVDEAVDNTREALGPLLSKLPNGQGDPEHMKEAVASDTKRVKGLVASAEASNAQARKEHKPPVSRCVP